MKHRMSDLTKVSTCWNIRKSKFYNPDAYCLHCGAAVSKHAKVCLNCLNFMRWQAEDNKDYQDTIASIRADWHR